MTQKHPLRHIALTVALATALTGPALAQDKAGRHGPDVGQMFERLDSDGDGSITREEFDAAPERRFAEADADGDGLISADEMLARWQARNTEEQVAARIARMMERMDRNGDGLLAADELRPTRASRMFDRIDADANGVLTRAEADAAAENWRGRVREHGKRGE